MSYEAMILRIVRLGLNDTEELALNRPTLPAPAFQPV